jgi:hypothetical protein
MTTRAALVVEGVGVVSVLTGDDLKRGIGVYQQALEELT